MRINLKGELFIDEWAELYRAFGYNTGFYCPADIRAALEACKPEDELVLEINSVGGHIDAAAEIYSVIYQAVHEDGRTIRAEIQSVACSAASYFLLSCSRVDISLPAQMMVHDVSWDIGGNKHDHRWAADQLETSDNSVLDLYCRKCGDKASRAVLEQLMEAETYIGARDALRLGLVDGIIGEAPNADGEPLALVAAVSGNMMRAMRTLPDIRELISRRDKEDWARQAEIDLERARY